MALNLFACLFSAAMQLNDTRDGIEWTIASSKFFFRNSNNIGQFDNTVHHAIAVTNHCFVVHKSKSMLSIYCKLNFVRTNDMTSYHTNRTIAIQLHARKIQMTDSIYFVKTNGIRRYLAIEFPIGGKITNRNAADLYSWFWCNNLNFVCMYNDLQYTVTIYLKEILLTFELRA